MENLLFYFLKVNIILVLFYGVYYLLLRKETFFQANRMFLLGGIVSAFIIPLLSYSKIVFIEPVELNYDDLLANATYSEEFVPIVEPSSFDWNYFVIVLYSLIVTILLAKLTLELYSFFNAIKSGNKNKVNKIVLVETTQFESPFSFFNYLVYNKAAFTDEELEFILTHENVHIKQFHSLDVLVGKLVSLVLWINPIAWLYRKAMLQNLEFIADAETTKELQNSYGYQKTLLKAVNNHNQLSITNQFYQSLIKKRIVMLNTNPSNKRNVWKYSVVLPMLVAFFLLYQVKTIAQVKETKVITEIQDVNRVEFIIDKNTTDSQIKEETDLLKKEHDVTVKVSKIKRNSKNEIKALEIKFKDKDGKTGKMSANGDDPIQPIVFYKEIDTNGKVNIGFGHPNNNVISTFSESMTWNSNSPEIETIEIKKTENGKNVYIINGEEYSDKDLKDKMVTVDGFIDESEDAETKKRIIVFNGDSKITTKEPKTMIFLDEKEISEDEMNALDTKIIKTVNVIKNGDNDEIKIITKNSNGIPEDTEIYINGVKSTKADLDAIEKEHIEMVNIKKLNDQNVIEIKATKEKIYDQKMPREIEKIVSNQLIEMKETKLDLEKRKAELEKRKEEMEKRKAEMNERKIEMEKMKAELAKTRAELEKLKEELKKKK
ncbi:M56 family metallopeptidase [Flavobacterium okayamense]|uniref:Peptidase M56 domain-containing protein n=1 Tax=Flavobacterium okayamense TaxID=2830782 RepID=A0ABM7SDP9_9FLAO|nr:M56 family metallopeptidase [Flavobacterium okayamense]BCY29326.1 hypothetical protein KK2020170_21940 [Flavobacterium okayamense]